MLRSLLFLDLYFLFFSFLLIFEPMGIFYQMQRGPLILIRPGHCIRQGFLVLMISDVSLFIPAPLILHNHIPASRDLK